jgi:hypothetical protein
MNDDAVNLAVKVGGSAAFGSAIALRFIPGNWWQRLTSFIGALGIGCLVGGLAMERFSLAPGSYTHMCAVATAAIFGLSIVHNSMQQIPEIIAALRAKLLGG